VAAWACVRVLQHEGGDGGVGSERCTTSRVGRSTDRSDVHRRHSLLRRSTLPQRAARHARTTPPRRTVPSRPAGGCTSVPLSVHPSVRPFPRHDENDRLYLNTINYTTSFLSLSYEKIWLNPLDSKGNHSDTSKNMKLVHWPLMDGLLHLVQREGDWKGCCPAQSPGRCTKYNSLLINGQCTYHYIAVWWSVAPRF